MVNNYRVLTIIDRGSCNNLISSDLVKKLGLTTHALPQPYEIQWFDTSGKEKVTHSARVHFSVGSYHDYADFHVVPMQACSLLLGHPWEFDLDAAHHGRSNKYSFMQHGNNIVLLPLTPAEILKFENERHANALDKSQSHDMLADVKKKELALLVMHNDLAAFDDHDARCYILPPLRFVVPNLL